MNTMILWGIAGIAGIVFVTSYAWAKNQQRGAANLAMTGNGIEKNVPVDASSLQGNGTIKAEGNLAGGSLSGEAKPVNLTKADFLAKVYNYEKNPDTWKYEGKTPAIVDFYADWCGPCKRLAPVLEELAKEYSGKVTIYKVNTENEQELASVFGIRSIPSLLFIPMDGQPQMSMGALPKADLKKAIKDVLKVE